MTPKNTGGARSRREGDRGAQRAGGAARVLHPGFFLVPISKCLVSIQIRSYRSMTPVVNCGRYLTLQPPTAMA